MEHFYLILFMISIQTTSLLEGAGVIETNFVEFRNIEGRRFDGKCCDKGGWWYTDSDSCSNECDHSFVICMGNRSESSSMTSCELGRLKTESIGGNKIKFNGNLGTMPNPLKFPFTTWPGLVKLKIDVIDEDDDDEYDFVDHYEYQYSTRDLRREIDTAPKSLVLSGSRTRFDLKLKVFCEAGFYGPDCSVFCKATDDETGHFICDPITGGKICKSGWEGIDCLTNIDDCVGHRCYYGSTCVDGVNYYSCLCPPGRTGFTCEAEINECASSPCQNGGECGDAANSFICQCKTGFVGPLCEIDFDECISGPCMNGGLCQDGIASVTCLCPVGFTGDFCQLEVDECDPNPCVQAEACVDLVADYRCECFPGYSGKNCDHNINECASSPCLNNGHCIDGVNSYSCICQYGDTGPNCELSIDFCDPNYCKNGAACHSLEDKFICECSQGFNGTLCELDVDECILDPCGRGRCINTVGGFICECDIGFGGSLCNVEVDECSVEDYPCQNSGTCVDLVAAFKCSCLEGFTGSLCEVDINECDNITCENGGHCNDLVNSFLCDCQTNFTGSFCETDMSLFYTQTSAETETIIMPDQTEHTTNKQDMYEKLSSYVPTDNLSMTTTALFNTTGIPTTMTSADDTSTLSISPETEIHITDTTSKITESDTNISTEEMAFSETYAYKSESIFTKTHALATADYASSTAIQLDDTINVTTMQVPVNATTLGPFRSSHSHKSFAVTLKSQTDSPLTNETKTTQKVGSISVTDSDRFVSQLPSTRIPATDIYDFESEPSRTSHTTEQIPTSEVSMTEDKVTYDDETEVFQGFQENETIVQGFEEETSSGDDGSGEQQLVSSGDEGVYTSGDLPALSQVEESGERQVLESDVKVFVSSGDDEYAPDFKVSSPPSNEVDDDRAGFSYKTTRILDKADKTMLRDISDSTSIDSRITTPSDRTITSLSVESTVSQETENMINSDVSTRSSSQETNTPYPFIESSMLSVGPELIFRGDYDLVSSASMEEDYFILFQNGPSTQSSAKELTSPSKGKMFSAEQDTPGYAYSGDETVRSSGDVYTPGYAYSGDETVRSSGDVYTPGYVYSGDETVSSSGDVYTSGYAYSGDKTVSSSGDVYTPGYAYSGDATESSSGDVYTPGYVYSGDETVSSSGDVYTPGYAYSGDETESSSGDVYTPGYAYSGDERVSSSGDFYAADHAYSGDETVSSSGDGYSGDETLSSSGYTYSGDEMVSLSGDGDSGNKTSSLSDDGYSVASSIVSEDRPGFTLSSGTDVKDIEDLSMKSSNESTFQSNKTTFMKENLVSGGAMQHTLSTVNETTTSETTDKQQPIRDSANEQIWIETNDTVPGDSQRPFINYTEYNLIPTGVEDGLSLTMEVDRVDFDASYEDVQTNKTDKGPALDLDIERLEKSKKSMSAGTTATTFTTNSMKGHWTSSETLFKASTVLSIAMTAPPKTAVELDMTETVTTHVTGSLRPALTQTNQKGLAVEQAEKNITFTKPSTVNWTQIQNVASVVHAEMDITGSQRTFNAAKSTSKYNDTYNTTDNVYATVSSLNQTDTAKRPHGPFPVPTSKQDSIKHRHQLKPINPWLAARRHLQKIDLMKFKSTDTTVKQALSHVESQTPLYKPQRTTDTLDTETQVYVQINESQSAQLMLTRANMSDVMFTTQPFTNGTSLYFHSTDVTRTSGAAITSDQLSSTFQPSSVTASKLPEATKASFDKTTTAAGDISEVLLKSNDTFMSIPYSLPPTEMNKPLLSNVSDKMRILSELSNNITTVGADGVTSSTFNDTVGSKFTETVYEVSDGLLISSESSRNTTITGDPALLFSTSDDTKETRITEMPFPDKTHLKLSLVTSEIEDESVIRTTTVPGITVLESKLTKLNISSEKIDTENIKLNETFPTLSSIPPPPPMIPPTPPFFQTAILPGNLTNKSTETLTSKTTGQFSARTSRHIDPNATASMSVTSFSLIPKLTKPSTNILTSPTSSTLTTPLSTLTATSTTSSALNSSTTLKTSRPTKPFIDKLPISTKTTPTATINASTISYCEDKLKWNRLKICVKSSQDRITPTVETAGVDNSTVPMKTETQFSRFSFLVDKHTTNYSQKSATKHAKSATTKLTSLYTTSATVNPVSPNTTSESLLVSEIPSVAYLATPSVATTPKDYPFSSISTPYTHFPIPLIRATTSTSFPPLSAADSTTKTFTPLKQTTFSSTPLATERILSNQSLQATVISRNTSLPPVTATEVEQKCVSNRWQHIVGRFKKCIKVSNESSFTSNHSTTLTKYSLVTPATTSTTVTTLIATFTTPSTTTITTPSTTQKTVSTTTWTIPTTILRTSTTMTPLSTTTLTTPSTTLTTHSKSTWVPSRTTLTKPSTTTPTAQSATTPTSSSPTLTRHSSTTLMLPSVTTHTAPLTTTETLQSKTTLTTPHTSTMTKLSTMLTKSLPAKVTTPSTTLMTTTSTAAPAIPLKTILTLPPKTVFKIPSKYTLTTLSSTSVTTLSSTTQTRSSATLTTPSSITQTTPSTTLILPSSTILTAPPSTLPATPLSTTVRTPSSTTLTPISTARFYSLTTPKPLVSTTTMPSSTILSTGSSTSVRTPSPTTLTLPSTTTPRKPTTTASTKPTTSLTTPSVTSLSTPKTLSTTTTTMQSSNTLPTRSSTAMRIPSSSTLTFISTVTPITPSTSELTKHLTSTLTKPSATTPTTPSSTILTMILPLSSTIQATPSTTLKTPTNTLTASSTTLTTPLSTSKTMPSSTTLTMPSLTTLSTTPISPRAKLESISLMILLSERMTSTYVRPSTRPTHVSDATAGKIIPPTSQLSVIRHIVDITSNNTYPNPRREITEYIRNRTIAKKKAVLKFKMIKVTVIRTVSKAAETGRRIVLQSYRRVKDIATKLTVTTYTRAKLLLKQALHRVGALWQYCKTGINHFVVKPLLNARVYVKHRFEKAYIRLGQLFERGRQILDTTVDTLKTETSSYFENLATYYSSVYRQYTTEVKDIFDSLKIPDS